MSEHAQINPCHVLSDADLPEAAALLALVQPAMSNAAWSEHLREERRKGHLLLGQREQGRLVGVIAVAPTPMSWLGAWRQAALVTGLAVLPGPGVAGRARLLVDEALHTLREQGCLFLLADAAPWTAGAGFVAQAPVTCWAIAPERIRRSLKVAAMRPVTEADLPAMADLYERRALGFSGALSRTGDDWERLWSQRSPYGPLHLFIAASDEACLGYVVLRGSDATSNQVTVGVDEWLDDGQAGLPAVVSFLGQLQGRAMTIQLAVPPDRSLAAWLNDPGPLSAQAHLGPFLRLADPAAVLALILPGSAPRLEGRRMHLTMSGGMMSLDTSVLAGLVAGSLDPASALAWGDLQGDDAACGAFLRAWPRATHFRFPRAGRRSP